MIIYRAKLIRRIIGWFYEKQWVLERADNSDYVRATCFVNWRNWIDHQRKDPHYLILGELRVTLEEGLKALINQHEGGGTWTETEHWRLRNVFTDEVIPEEILC